MSYVHESRWNSRWRHTRCCDASGAIQGGEYAQHESTYGEDPADSPSYQAIAMNPQRRVFIVQPAPADGWLVREAHDENPQQFSTKEQAMEAAKKLAQAHGPSVLQVQSGDGAI